MPKTGFLEKVNVLTLLYVHEELQRNTKVILFFILDILLADIVCCLDSCGGHNSKKTTTFEASKKRDRNSCNMLASLK